MGELRGLRILVTGPAGQIAFPLARSLARHNEVWGIARFSQPGSRERVEAAGVRAEGVELEARRSRPSEGETSRSSPLACGSLRAPRCRASLAKSFPERRPR